MIVFFNLVKNSHFSALPTGIEYMRKDELENQLISENSIDNILNIVSHIGNNAERFRILLDITEQGDDVVSRRASWAAMHCCDKHPILASGEIGRLVTISGTTKSQAIKRNIIRILQFQEIPDQYQGAAYDTCFSAMLNPAETIAVRAFSMQVVFNIAAVYPELQTELVVAIKEILPYGSKGLASKGNKLIKVLEKNKIK